MAAMQQPAIGIAPHTHTSSCYKVAKQQPAINIIPPCGPLGSLVHRCQLCSAAGSRLLRCAECRAVRYCSREHQVAHSPRHEADCVMIKNSRAKANIGRDDNEVRNAAEDFISDDFLCRYRDYMQARYDLAQQLRSLGTLDGVSEGLEHLQHLLRLYRGDDLFDVRLFIPATMLRLDLDQECYDFLLWWLKNESRWFRRNVPYLDIHGADVHKNFYPGSSRFNHPEFMLALIFLKLKLLIDIRNIKITRKIFAQRHILPLELQDQIEQHVVRSPLSAKFHRESYASLIRIETKLVINCRRIGERCCGPYLMYYLFKPLRAFRVHHRDGDDGTKLNGIAIQNTYDAFWETEGLLELLEDARQCAWRDVEIGNDDWNRYKKRGWDADIITSHLSLTWIWKYLGYAVENASYLGPRSERPSKRYAREKLAKAMPEMAKAMAEKADHDDKASDDGD